MTTLLNRKRGFLAILFCAAWSFAHAQSAAPAAPAPAHDFARWEKDVAAFEASDRTAPPPKNALLFVGSSTIVRWKTLQQDYPAHPIINRGFGGNEIADSTHFADRIIFPYQPRTIFLRAGGNDIHNGKTPEQVFADFKAFVATVRAKLAEDRDRLHLALTQHRPVGRTGRREEAQRAHRRLREPHTTPEIHRNLRPGARCQGRAPAGSSSSRTSCTSAPRATSCSSSGSARSCGNEAEQGFQMAAIRPSALCNRCSPGRRSVASGR